MEYDNYRAAMGMITEIFDTETYPLNNRPRATKEHYTGVIPG